jgi:predicted RNA-binding protein YlxR (DUF448 family)
VTTTPTPPASAPAPAAKAARRRGGKKGKRVKALKLEEPHRMCVACRASKPQHELLRFARSTDGAVGFDLKNRLPGVGAWVCASPSCLGKALDVKVGAFARAFDAPVVFDPPTLKAMVQGLLAGEVKNALGLLRRQGTLILGREEVVRRAPDLAAIGLATDLSDNSRHELTERAPGVPQLALPTMAEIGQATGGRPVGVVGVPVRGGDPLHNAVRRWQAVVGAVAGGSAPAAEA